MRLSGVFHGSAVRFGGTRRITGGCLNMYFWSNGSAVTSYCAVHSFTWRACALANCCCALCVAAIHAS